MPGRRSGRAQGAPKFWGPQNAGVPGVHEAPADAPPASVQSAGGGHAGLPRGHRLSVSRRLHAFPPWKPTLTSSPRGSTPSGKTVKELAASCFLNQNSRLNLGRLADQVPQPQFQVWGEGGGLSVNWTHLRHMWAPEKAA